MKNEPLKYIGRIICACLSLGWSVIFFYLMASFIFWKWQPLDDWLVAFRIAICAGLLAGVWINIKNEESGP